MFSKDKYMSTCTAHALWEKLKEEFATAGMLKDGSPFPTYNKSAADHFENTSSKSTNNFNKCMWESVKRKIRKRTNSIVI